MSAMKIVLMAVPAIPFLSIFASIAELTGTAISASFLAALILVTLELSIASPGTTSAWTIMLTALSLPTGYVGLFTVYRLLTANYGAACTEAYTMLEAVEAAYRMDGIEQ